jgi:hypothetical protein
MIKYKVLVRSNRITKIGGDKTRSSKDISKSTSLLHNLQFRSVVIKLLFFYYGEQTSVQSPWYATFRIVTTFLNVDLFVADPSGCAA